jgi:hypothetical protein
LHALVCKNVRTLTVDFAGNAYAGLSKDVRRSIAGADPSLVVVYGGVS